MKVQDLLVEQGNCWDQNLVEQLFSLYEAHQILQILISHSNASDQLLWTPEQHGKYTVQSAYKLAQLHKVGNTTGAETSYVGEERKRMWQKVWKLPVKPKVKYFLWKCIHGWLATNLAIKKRGVIADNVCRRCGLDKETKEHFFSHCEESGGI